MNMKRNMGVGEKMREKQREKEIWQWWRNEKKEKRQSQNMLVATVKTKKLLSNTDHSYTKCEH